MRLRASLRNADSFPENPDPTTRLFSCAPAGEPDGTKAPSATIRASGPLPPLVGNSSPLTSAARADADPLVAAMKTAGMKVISEGGGAVPIPPNFKGALVADPNNFFLTPFAPCDGSAPGILAPER